jgi:hypothetical protein
MEELKGEEKKSRQKKGQSTDFTTDLGQSVDNAECPFPPAKMNE